MSGCSIAHNAEAGKTGDPRLAPPCLPSTYRQPALAAVLAILVKFSSFPRSPRERTFSRSAPQLPTQASSSSPHRPDLAACMDYMMVEPWKGSSRRPEVECHWGIYDTDRVPKPARYLFVPHRVWLPIVPKGH